jgi:hypothetical protein
MDQELIAYLDERFGKLDERFREADERFDERFLVTDERFGKFDERFDKLDERLRETNESIRRVDERIMREFQDFREETFSRFEKADETARQTLVLVEDIRHQIHLVAEGYRVCDDKLAKIENDREHYTRSIHMEDPVKDLDNRVSILEGWVARHQDAVGESIRKLTVVKPSQPPLLSE